MENENTVIEPKKKRPIFLIVMLIILGVGCILGGYYLSTIDVFGGNEVESDGTITGEISDTTGENQNEQSETTITKEKNEYEILIDKYMKGNPPANCGSIEVFAKDKVVTASNINSLYAANTVTMNMSQNTEDRPDTISLEDFTKEVKKYYGENYEFNSESLVNTQSLEGYIYKDGVFTKHSNNWGGTCGPVSSYVYSDAKKDGDNLEVYVHVIFNGITSDGMTDGTYYADYNRTKRIEEFNYSNEEDYKRGSLYKFTFKLVNENYVFISSEPVKD